MMDSKPPVSIGMPVYNGEQYIREALDSLLAQDYEDFELIISDDASTDGTQEISLEYAARDGRIRYHRNERNMGMAWNFNRALELSSGDYFMWASQHDCWDPSFISACKQMLDDDPSVVSAYPRTRLIDGTGETIVEVLPEFIDTRNLLTVCRVHLIISEVNSCTMIYGLHRTSALRRCRPFPTCTSPDHVVVLEMSILGAIAQVPEVLFCFRDYRPAVTYDEKVAIMLMRLNPDASKRKKVRPYWEWGVQSLLGVWRLAHPLTKKFYLTAVAAHAFYSRWWHSRLKRELRQPFPLQRYKKPDF